MKKSEKIEDLVTEQEFEAIAKTSKGKGSEGEQKLAIKTIALKLCNLNGNSFCPENSHQTAFNEGMRYIGRMILKMDQVESDFFVKLRQIKESADKINKSNPQNQILINN